MDNQMDNHTLPQLLQKIVKDFSGYAAQYSKDKEGVFQPTTYETLYKEVQIFAAGLMSAGIQRGDHVGLISDNRKEWFITDLALLCLGAADVPRGCDSLSGELVYILSFADCKTVILENEQQMLKILPHRDKMPLVSAFIIFDNDFDKTPHAAGLEGLAVFGFNDIMKKGEELIAREPECVIREIAVGKPDDLATIIFTSGTTGEPKGVMLSHRNFMHQVVRVPLCITLGPGDIWLCVLPVWHSFERLIQYASLGAASALAYSKPIGKIMLADCRKIQPTWLASVPRIWEAVRAGVYRNVNAGGGLKKALFAFFVGVGQSHEKMKNLLYGRVPQFRKRSRLLDILVSLVPYFFLFPLRTLGNVLVFHKIRAMLGRRFVAGISGGGAMPDTVDKFFAAAGILIIEGYGLTETAPVIGVRRQNHPVPETVGPPFPDMEVTVRNPETGEELPPGQQGSIYAKGPQVMLGYYKKPEETQKIIDASGRLNTGDIGIRTWQGEIKITGRAKDTIVLLGGENIEPTPIEARIRESDYIDHALVLGQDQKYLAALIVPNFEKLEAYAAENSIPFLDRESLLTLPQIRTLIDSEIQIRINRKTGFRGFEMIYRCALIPKPFEMGVELSGKQDYKRHVIGQMYKKEIAQLFTDV
ncbi:MAG: AMP-binding protein [Spirochaetales bacterium]|jgi:long-chain acyl-CoA synthetase|nr:AMP-binding protein [Spirochaetales bacterium]